MPIVLGMLLSLTMVICNFIDLQWLIVFIMAVSFLGKGFGSLGWAVLSDTAPKEIAGLSGALFNMFGNISSITTPIIIGFTVQKTASPCRKPDPSTLPSSSSAQTPSWSS